MKIRSVLLFLLVASTCSAVHLSPNVSRTFDSYIASVEKHLNQQHASTSTYIGVLDTSPAQRLETDRELRSGAVRVQPIDGGSWEESGGLLHHWRGAIFAPRATRAGMLALLQDYDHLPDYYPSEVVSSRALARHGNTTTLAMRLRKQVAVSLVFDAEYQVEAGLTGSSGGYGISRSLHVWQVDAPGTSREHRRREGDDDGFLWRINAYWSFLQVPDGLLIECEAVSLTRGIPPGLGWLVAPIIKELPRTSLESTLIATRDALAANAAKEQQR